MKELVFATHNKHKFAEVQQMLPENFLLRSLSDIGCHEPIAETAETLEGNSRIKAAYVKHTYGLDCFADDTGLEVEALNGAPGVYSARYAGETADAEKNMQKLLQQLQGVTDRRAQFRTVITLVMGETYRTFEGRVTGWITNKPEGSGGFGYDPVFRPEGYRETFAELSLAEKNRISHRGRAFESLYAFLKTIV
ncbi:non-canonical purine NTP diphosphatase [Robiginitalea sp. IMCC44478]|uniref:non-canonical purine NTP diphosphatase n=1 Tax=Robiginitalea sp. IMCC44478 TaxID=3459122 RepID=UPI00404256B0